MDFSPQLILTNFFAIIISLTIHEFAHAWVADRMGDPTPRRHDRLNLNPLTIIRAEPLGAFIVPLILSFTGSLFAWASTPVNPHLVHRKYTLRQAERWIAIAGPLSNAIFALISALFYVLLVKYMPEEGELTLWLAPLVPLMGALVYTNIVLALFNMIPVEPLDGFTVLESSLPRNLSHITRMIRERRVLIFLFVFMFAGRLLGPIIYSTQMVLIGFFAQLVG